MIDRVVSFSTYRTRCTRMRCSMYGILRQIPAYKNGIGLHVIGIGLRVIGTVEEYAYKDPSVSKSSFPPVI